MTASRPLLLLDVDGPLNPFAGTNKPRQRAGYRRYPMRPDGWDGPGPLPVWLHAAHGPMLTGLASRAGLDLVWATTWQDQANTLIAPRIGLPRLPIIEFDDTSDGWVSSWKFGPVDAYAAGRPLAWFDDDFDLHAEAMAAFLDRRAGVPTLLHRVDPACGLTVGDIDAVATWARDLAGPVTTA